MGEDDKFMDKKKPHKSKHSGKSKNLHCLFKFLINIFQV